MASFNFDLLELADGESGEAAVSVVVGKAKADAAHAKKADAAAAAAATATAESAAAATGSDKEKAALKNLYYTKLQYDNGIKTIQYELKRLREVLIKLRGEEKKLKETGVDGRHLLQLSQEQRELRFTQLSEEQRNLREQQKKLRHQEAKLRLPRKEFYLEHGFPLEAVDKEEPPVPVPNQGESVQGNDNAGPDSFNGSLNNDGYESYHNGEQDVHDDGPYLYHERQVEEGYAYNNNGGGRQGYPEVHNKRKVQKYVRKTKQPSSDADTEADHKPEEKVTSDAGSEAEHKPVENDKEEAATPVNADAAPGSGSENSSAAGAAGSNNGQDGLPRNPDFKFVPKEKLSGSAKRKKKNAQKNGGNGAEKAKQDSSEPDVSKKTDKEPQAVYPRKEEEEKTLAEYERICEEKKKSSEDVSRSEQRKVSADEFKGLQMLEKKKKLDDEEAVMKAEKVQSKAKEAGKKEEKPQPEAAKDVKPKKVATPMSFKELSFAPPRRNVVSEDGSSSNGGGGAPRGRFNGGSGFQGRSSRDNSTDSSRAPPTAGRGGGGDNGRAFQNEAGNYGNGGAPRSGYSGGGRGYGAPRGDYSVGRGDGYSGGRGNGGYHGNGGSGYHQQQQQQGGYQRNDNYYRPRGRGYYSGNGGRNPAAPKPIVVEDMNLFPPLPAAASAPAGAAAAPAAATVPAQS